MSKNKTQVSLTPERPALVSTNLTCKRCVYANSINPNFMGSCREVFGIKQDSKACVQYTLNVEPSYYRNDPNIIKYNKTASEKYSDIPDLMDEVVELSGRVFSKSIVRSGTREELARVKEVLRKENDTSALVPFFEEVQRYRDRVSEIQSLSIMWQGQLSIMFDEAETYLMKYNEIRNLKPEAVRKSITQSIISELKYYSTMVEALHKQCDAALRNFTSQHNALVEIQMSAKTPVSIPSWARTDISSPIRRGTNRRERTK